MSLKASIRAKAHELLAEIEKLGEEGLEEAEKAAKAVVPLVETGLCTLMSDGLKCTLPGGHEGIHNFVNMAIKEAEAIAPVLVDAAKKAL